MTCWKPSSLREEILGCSPSHFPPSSVFVHRIRITNVGKLAIFPQSHVNRYHIIENCRKHLFILEKKKRKEKRLEKNVENYKMK